MFQVWCCVAKHGLVTLVVIMILKDTAIFQVLYCSFFILCLEHRYCGDQQWRSLTWKLNLPVPLFTSGGLGLGGPWSWSSYWIWSSLYHTLWSYLSFTLTAITAAEGACRIFWTKPCAPWPRTVSFSSTPAFSWYSRSLYLNVVDDSIGGPLNRRTLIY